MKQLVTRSILLFIFLYAGILTGCTANSPEIKGNGSQELTNSAQSFVKNQYILRFSGVSDAKSKIEVDFQIFGIVEYKRIRDQVYLLEIEHDPGIEAMTDHCNTLSYIKSVQRNMVYKQIQKAHKTGQKLK